MKLLKNKYFILGNLFLILLAIPLTLFLVNRQQQTQSQAEASSVLSMDPATKTVSVGDEFTLDVQIDPGQNQVGAAKMRISYDPSKIEFQGIAALPPFTNTTEPQVASSSGVTTVDVLLNVGGNVTAAIRGQSAKIATVTFKALAPTEPTTPVDFIRASTELRSVAEADAVGEDVLQSATGAVITILGETACTTRPACLDEQPACNIPEPEGGWCPPPTKTPTPSDNGKAVCTNLSSTDTTGTAPLSVTLSANGNDPDGTITQATFNFGDGQTDEVTDNLDTQSVLTEVDHTYESAGSYQVKVSFTDDQGLAGNPCTLTITVSNEGEDITAAPTSTDGTTTTTDDTITDEDTSIAEAATATPTQIENTASPTIAPTGGIVQTIGIFGAIVLSIIGGIFLLTL